MIFVLTILLQILACPNGGSQGGTGSVRQRLFKASNNSELVELVPENPMKRRCPPGARLNFRHRSDTFLIAQRRVYALQTMRHG